MAIYMNYSAVLFCAFIFCLESRASSFPRGSRPLPVVSPDSIYENTYIFDYISPKSLRSDSEIIIDTQNALNNNAYGSQSGSIGIVNHEIWVSNISIENKENLYVAGHSLAEAPGTVRKIGLDGKTKILLPQMGLAQMQNKPNDISIRGKLMRGAIANDNMGNIYFSDNCSIKKYSSNGTLTVFAGDESISGYRDGTHDIALFSDQIRGLVPDSYGNLYVADTLNNVIRKITLDGVVSTVAGSVKSGYMDGVGINAKFNHPQGLAIDTSGNVFVADTLNHAVRRIEFDGGRKNTGSNVTTLAGRGEKSGLADGNVHTSYFNMPSAVAIDNVGNIYVADSANTMIRKIYRDGKVTTLAGRYELPVSGSNSRPGSDSLPLRPGIGSEARIGNPTSITIGSDNVIYISTNGVIMKGTPLGKQHK